MCYNVYIIGKWLGDIMEDIKKILTAIGDFFIFDITIPFKLFKYLNLGFYYIIRLLLRETPEQKKEREEREKKRKEELEKEQAQAKAYLKQNSEYQHH